MIIGLTGNTGAGKSTVSNYFKTKYNAQIIDADHIGHIIIKKGQITYEKLIKTFSIKILDDEKEIDRKKLANIVFNDKNKLKVLNEITHKAIMEKIYEEIDTIKNKNLDNKFFIIIDVPLIFETNLPDLVDQIWAVTSDLENRMNRIMERDNIDYKSANARIQSQISIQKYKNKIDYIINNNGVVEDTLSQCDKLYYNLKLK